MNIRTLKRIEKSINTIVNLEPKVNSYDEIIDEDGTSTTDFISKIIGNGFRERLIPINEPIEQNKAIADLMSILTDEELHTILEVIEEEEEQQHG